MKDKDNEMEPVSDEDRDVIRKTQLVPAQKIPATPLSVRIKIDNYKS